MYIVADLPAFIYDLFIDLGHVNGHSPFLCLGKGKFPARVVKEFLNQISLFPVNSYVKLNNGSIGRVISTNKEQPMQPVIELILDGLGKKLEKKAIIRLSDSPLLHIVGTTNEEDLSSRGLL